MKPQPSEIHVTIDEVVVAGLSRVEAGHLIAELRQNLATGLANGLNTTRAPAPGATGVPAVQIEAPRGSGGAGLGRATARGILRTLRFGGV